MISLPFVGRMRSKMIEDEGYSLEKIREASPSELAEIDGFSEKIAKRLIKYAKQVKKNYEVPDELIFKEFRCPQCGAIVSEIEPKCHKCGNVFFDASPHYESLIDGMAKIIIELYKNPRNAKLWREGSNILTHMGMEKKAADFKFRASSIEIESMESPEEKSSMTTKGHAAELYSKRKIAVGQINGLVNGSGAVINKTEKRRNPLRVLVVALILIVPTVFTGVIVFGTQPSIVINGHFADWASKPSYGLAPGFFKDFKCVNYDANTYMYIRASHLFSNSTMQTLAILVDEDSNNKTGYPVDALGVDKAIFLYGTRGNITERVMSYGKSWVSMGKVKFAIGTNAIELKSFEIRDTARILLYYNDGLEHYSSVITKTSHLWALQEGGAVLSAGDTASQMILWNSGTGKISVDNFYMWNAGNGTANVSISVDNLNINTKIGDEKKMVHLPQKIEIGKPIPMKVIYKGGGKRFQTIKPMISFTKNFTVIDKAEGSYIAKIPAKKSIDGIFLDWNNATYNRRGKLPENIDISKYGTSTVGNISLYLSVYGMMFGTGVPEIKVSGGNGSAGGSVTHNKSLPADTLEIYVDSDKNSATGYKVGDIGADYLIRISGRYGTVLNESAYRWGGSWYKCKIRIEKAKNYNSIEIGLPLKGRVYFRLVNFDGLWDRINHERYKVIRETAAGTHNNSSDKSGELGKPAYKKSIPKFVGEYNATELRALFGTDVQVTTSTYDESMPTITRTSDGTLWTTFASTGPEIYFANSTDDGSTWTVYHFSDTADYSNPVIISDSSDNVYIFMENHTSNSYFGYMEYQNGNWNLESVSSWTWWDNVYNISAVNYTVSSTAYIYVVFEYAYSSTDYDIGYVKTTDGGSSWWDYHDNLANTTNWEGHPSVTVSTGSNPEIFVAFQNYSSTDKWCVIVLNNTNINGTSWWGFYFESAYSKNLTNPSIFATGDDIYMVAQDEYQSTDHDIGLYNSTDNGLNWKWGSWVNDTSDNELYPSVIANGANVYVFFLDATTGYICEKGSTDYGQTWGSVNVVSDQGSGVSIYRTVFSYYYNGNLYVVWTDNRNGNDDIYFDTVPEFSGFSIVVMILVMATIAVDYRRKRFK